MATIPDNIACIAPAPCFANEAIAKLINKFAIDFGKFDVDLHWQYYKSASNQFSFYRSELTISMGRAVKCEVTRAGDLIAEAKFRKHEVSLTIAEFLIPALMDKVEGLATLNSKTVNYKNFEQFLLNLEKAANIVNEIQNEQK